ncbi:MAG: hypothetical protein ACE5IR_19040 [bacterium]
MKTTGNIAFIAALLLISFSDVIGQEEERVKVGDRVRVTAPDVSKLKLDREGNVILSAVVGTVVTFEADTLVLKAEGQATPLTVPLVSLKKLEVSRGRKSHWLTGLGIGAIVGTFLAGIAANDSKGFESQTFGTYFLEYSAVGVPVFGGIGAGIGALIKTERWREVPLEKVSMNIMPNSHGGFLFSISLTY